MRDEAEHILLSLDVASKGCANNLFLPKNLKCVWSFIILFFNEVNLPEGASSQQLIERKVLEPNSLCLSLPEGLIHLDDVHKLAASAVVLWLWFLFLLLERVLEFQQPLDMVCSTVGQ